MNIRIVFTTIIFTVAIIYGAFTSMATTIQPLPDKWDILFKDSPDVITKFATETPIHLKNVRIENHDLSDTTIPNAVFENIEWSDFVAIDSHFINTRFTGGIIESSGFSRSTFSHVIFDSIIFTDVEFIAAKLIDVTFKNCKIYNSKLRGLINSKILIENSELSNVEFYESELDITLKNTRVIELGMFGGLQPGSRVNLDNSYIGPYSDFSYSNIASFKAVNSVLDQFPMGDYIGEIVLEKSVLNFTLASANIDSLIVSDCIIKKLTHGDAMIRSVIVKDCPSTNRLSFMTTTIEKLTIRNCNVSSFSLWDAIVGIINISNVKLDKGENEGLKAKELILHNVTFTGETIFKGALADHADLYKVTFSHGATLDASGSNIPFER